MKKNILKLSIITISMLTILVSTLPEVMVADSTIDTQQIESGETSDNLIEQEENIEVADQGNEIEENIEVVDHGIVQEENNIDENEGLLSLIDIKTREANELSNYAVETPTTSVDALSFDGTGRLTAYDPTKNPFGTKVIVPDSITTSFGSVIVIKVIGSNAFKGDGVTEVVLPDTITSIESDAFTGNPITSITFPSGDIAIGSRAFKNCAFTNFTFTNKMKIKSTNQSILEGNSSLNTVVFEEGITVVPSSTFKNCTSLTNVTLPSTLKSIDSYAFNKTALESITLPNGLEQIGSGVFYMSKLKHITIPDSVTIIRDSAFESNKLESVKLSINLSEMGQQAFKSNLIKEIEIPATLSELPTRAFHSNKISKLVLNGGLTKVGDYAFAYNDLNSLIVPSSVITIGFNAFASNVIADIELNEGLKTINNDAFYMNKISKIVLPNSLEKLGNRVFQYNSIGFAIVPSNVNSLESDSFSKQVNVKSEYIKRENLYLYEIPEGVDVSKITSKIGYVDSAQKDVELSADNRYFTSLEILTKLVYKATLANQSVSTVIEVELKPVIKKHSVVFKDYDDTVLSEVVVEDSKTITSIPVTNAREGYTFIGWDKSVENITESQIITAEYKSLPTITVNDKTITVGSTFDPLQGVLARDADGGAINTITIVNNNVNIAVIGEYEVMLSAEDKWGGVNTKTYKVTVTSASSPEIKPVPTPEVNEPDKKEDESTGDSVKKVYINTILKDTRSEISVEGLFENNAAIIVELIPVPADSLIHKINDKELLDSFEVHIIGEYYGDIVVSFPVDKKYEGETIYIYHEKTNGEIEEFIEIVKDAQVQVTVDELSPFILTMEKNSESDDLVTKPTDHPTSPSIQDPNTKTDGIKSMFIIAGFSLLLIIIVLLIVVNEYRKRNKK